MELSRSTAKAKRACADKGYVAEAALLCAQIADALEAAHGMGIAHRDIKPRNIMLNEHNRALLLDFGLAKAADDDVSMTQSGTGMGTPLYMAPEQARNAKTVDLRADIYALGCSLYHFLSG